MLVNIYVGHNKRTVTRVDLMIQQLDRTIRSTLCRERIYIVANINFEERDLHIYTIFKRENIGK